MRTPRYIKLRPETVRILGRRFDIHFVPDSPLLNSAVGVCNNTALYICVAEDQHPVEEMDTLLHELMHAVWFVMSASLGGADEEQIVRRISTGLTGVLADNPSLLAYFAAVVKEANQ